MTDTLIRFGRCEVDLSGREVRLDGRPSPIEPRPFDLLVHLIRHRNRVVPKRELLDQIWPREPVSESALARAVMKARQAIGDDGDEPLLRTVPRVGYRFVAPVAAEASPPAASWTPALPDTTGSTIALLPFDNATGDPSLDWIGLGLMSVAASALENDARLSPVSLQTLLTAIGGARSEGAEQLAPAVQQATGARFVVRSRVSRSGSRYRLEFVVFGHPEQPQGDLSAEHPGELGARLAGALTLALFPAQPPVNTAALAFDDLIALEAFARGMQAAAEQKWPQAANLYRLALDHAPGHAGAQLELLRALAPMGDLEARRIARRLLARAERGNDLLLAARVHQALGRLYGNRMTFSAAAFHLEQALRLGADEETPDATAHTLLLKGIVSMQLREFGPAQHSLQHMQRLCDGSGNRILPLAGLNMQAVIASTRGELERAVELSSEVVRRARALRAPRYLVDACANAAYDLINLGRLSEAAPFAEEGFGTAASLGDWQIAASTAHIIGWLYRLVRAPEALARIISALPPPEQLGRPDGVWNARAHHAASLGRHDEAAHGFRQAIEVQRASGSALLEQTTLPWLIDALVLCGQAEEARAELDRLSRPPYSDNTALALQALHCAALLAHARGDAPQALALLDRLRQSGAAPLWQAWACIDAAWLHAEADRPAEAEQTLGEVRGPLGDTPLAWATRARIRCARGDAAGALAAHQRYADAAGTPPADDHFLRLGALYAGIAGGTVRAGTPLPAARFLASRL